MKLKFISLAFLLLIHFSCGTGFLDEKPNIKQRVPQTLEDYMGLLDNSSMMNVSSHILGMIGADEYYISDADYNMFPSGPNYNYQKHAYTWDEQIFEGGEANRLDWNDAFERLLWINTALDGLNRLDVTAQDREKANVAKGIALFQRAWNYYCLAQLFCRLFAEESAETDLGLPLRLEPDLTLKIPRSDLGDTYRQIIRDVEEAAELLPMEPATSYRPGKPAAYALLSRLFLQMGNYEEAYINADRCLKIKPGLMDYNRLDLTKSPTFPAYGEGNPEVLFTTTVSGNSLYLRMLLYQFVNPDSTLLNSYTSDDLRYPAYFYQETNGKFTYKGSYEGSNLQSYFTGLAIDEVYLNRAECAVRLGNKMQALADLNYLRKNRLVTVNYTELSSNDEQQLLDWIIQERRKELVFRGTRWEDLRRLNKEARYQKTLVRVTGDVRKELPSGDPRYVWPLPVEVIQLGGYEQNIR